jgi:phenylacetate-coenzyme A ligase PaaK-like adenylate-forming protein
MSDLLHASAADIRAVQDSKLRDMLALCARGHAYYRRVWREAGVDIASIKGVDDLAKLPLTPKQALMGEPENFRLNCPDLPLHERSLWEVLHTTGTTSNPTPIYVTTHDYNGYLFLSRRVAAIAGMSGDDRIANLFPLAQASMGAFIRSAETAYAIGATICAALPGARYGEFGNHRSLDQAVGLIERHKVTVLWGLTTFVRRVIVRAAELGADFSSVRICAITGEASSSAMREDMRVRLRAVGATNPVIFDRYGSTESGGLAQCQEDGPWHNPAPELIYHEVVDLATGQPLPDGERGALAITHLDHRGTVLIRYVVGDVISLDRAPCPHCGRTSERLCGPVVRTKDLIKVKGMLINPAVLLDKLQALPGLDDFQVVIRKETPSDPFSMDQLNIRVATQSLDREELAAAIIAETAGAVGVTPKVEFVTERELFDPAAQAKAVRFVDARAAVG